MTAATLSRLPLTAGGTLVGSLGRGVFWTLNRLLDLGFWAGAQFMRAPLPISAVIAVAGFSILAGSNALYFQTGRHPAPLFYSPARQAAPAPAVRPVMPAPRPHLLPASIDNGTTGSVGNQATANAIDNDDVMALQQKLVALKLLDATPDGIFGRRTAAAIKAFEAKAGMKADGRLTPVALAAILGAPASAAQLLPAAQPLPAVTTTIATAAPLAEAAAPAVASAKTVPLSATTAAAPVATAIPAPDAIPPAAIQLASAPATDTFAANSEPAAEPASAAEASTDGGTAAPADSGVSSVAMAAAPASPAAASPDGSMSPAQRLAAQMGTLPPDATTANALPPATMTTDDLDGSTDPVLITKIQRALASLGFLGAKIDGVPGEGTAKAIRNFEVFYDYKVTGLATHQLLNLLMQHGAVL